MINWAVLASYLLTLLVMIVLPIYLSIVMVRRYRASWWVVLAGATAYALYYLSTTGVDALFSNGKLPVPPTTWPTVLRIVLFGLISAILEEGIRWISLKLVGAQGEKFASAPALGIAHSGAENIFYGVLSIGTPLVTYLFYNPGREIANGTAIATVQSMLNTISAFWAQPFYVGLVQGGVALVTLSVQILMSIFIWKSIHDRNFGWFGLAVIYDVLLFLFNSYLGQLNLPSYVTIGIMFLIFISNIYLSYRFFTDETEAEEEEEEENEADEIEEEEEEEGEAKDFEDEEEEEISEPESSLDLPATPDADDLSSENSEK